MHPSPTHRVLSQMKIRLKGAQKGHSLLKKKADALTLRFRQILGKIIEVGIVKKDISATKLHAKPHLVAKCNSGSLNLKDKFRPNRIR